MFGNTIMQCITTSKQDKTEIMIFLLYYFREGLETKIFDYKRFTYCGKI